MDPENLLGKLGGIVSDNVFISKKEGKDQESIQSSIPPDPRYHAMGK